ncbi:MAG: RNA polymerase Rpb4 family protein [Candidatus Micrarchaeota archaeon]
MQVKSTRPVSVCEAKEILVKRKEDGELGYEQGQAHDNSERFGTMDPKKAEKLVEMLKGFGKITDELAIKIVDIRPDNAATLRAVLVKDRVELSEDDLNTIVKELA